MEKPILSAIRILGSQRLLADAIGVNPKTVWAWVNRDRVPAEYCPAIERATDGEVRCEELRPDADWAYLRSSSCAVVR